jgi:hypothetical protein
MKVVLSILFHLLGDDCQSTPNFSTYINKQKNNVYNTLWKSLFFTYLQIREKKYDFHN